MKSEGVTRRGILGGAAGLAAGLGSVSQTVAKGRRLDLSDPDDSLYAVVKLRGDVAGGRVLQWYTGELALLVPGRMPEPVASYQGVVRTDWTPRPDGAFDYRTFDLGYFGDLATGEAAESLTNPVNGADVLDRTCAELLARYDGLASVGIVPLGVSRYNTEASLIH